MFQISTTLWLLWLSSHVIRNDARVSGNGSHSHIVMIEKNDVRKLLVSASGEGNRNSSTTSGKQQNKKSNSTDDEEEKKTLAQQVADGKYGLIQTEIFDKPYKRPGIISYDNNPEVPKDNVNNLGGLHADEIWLAENHLLVLKGGGFSDKDTENITWKSIDNYVAPKRQVKIPPKPKVAPPFPIQLREGGPIEFIQGEKSSFRPFGRPPFLPPDVKNNLSVLPPAFSYPFPPFGLPPPPSFPFPSNLSDLDEDDPRFYYPPPYDFVYDKDNSSYVAPGPLVPGIVLPPPADFFAPLVNSDKRPAQKPSKRPVEHDKNKHNRVQTFLPKTTYTSKPKVTTHESSSVFSSVKPKNKEVMKTLPEPKEKEGRKLEGSKRPLSTTPAAIIRPLDVTTKFSRVVTYPPETTTVYTRVVTRPPLILSTTSPQIKLPKTSAGDWVPIVGPSICPPTDFECFDLPINREKIYSQVNSILNTTEKPYELVTKIPKVESVTRNNDFYPINGPRSNYFTSTSSPYYDLNPIIVPTAVTTSSYKSVEPNTYDPGETYYIYEEPVVPAAKVILREFDTPEIKNGPTIVYVNHDVRPKFELNTVSPLQVLREQTIKKPRVKVKNKPSPLELFENELSTITNSNKFSITYSVGDRQPHVNQLAGYSYNEPFDDPFGNIIKNSHRNSYRNKKGRSKEVKTPVFEYSFSVPGYGQNDSPKISSVIPSTEKPDSIIRNPHYSFFGFDSRPVVHSDRYIERNTQSPLEYSSQKPKYRKVILNQLKEFLVTEAPYTQLYTQQEPEFIDDITKNYFTLFGKKINGEVYPKYLTTPLSPPADEGIFYAGTKQRQRAPEEPKRQNIRFPEEISGPMEASKNLKEQDYLPQNVDIKGNQTPRPAVPKPENYNSRYYNSYRPKYYQRDYSLASDVNVNYRKPYPRLNPEAEYIDSSYVRGENIPTNSYISYQLPGNGGHFYFLTPQNIHATNYPVASSALSLPSRYNNMYFKRNAQTSSN